MVTAETCAGTTSFSYDNILRLTSTQPPGGFSVSAPTTIQYEADRTVVTRGSSQVTTNLDGFGRTTCIVNRHFRQRRTSTSDISRKQD